MLEDFGKGIADLLDQSLKLGFELGYLSGRDIFTTNGQLFEWHRCSWIYRGSGTATNSRLGRCLDL